MVRNRGMSEGWFEFEVWWWRDGEVGLDACGEGERDEEKMSSRRLGCGGWEGGGGGEGVGEGWVERGVKEGEGCGSRSIFSLKWTEDTDRAF